MMNRVRLEREISTVDGSFGVMVCESRHYKFPLVLQSLELPWRDNERNISCIPPGKYQVESYLSSRHGQCYLVKAVPGRSGILIHVGNVAGDRESGLDSNVEGCILVGMYRGCVGDQNAVMGSGTAVKRLMTFMNGESFELTIELTSGRSYDG